jgi:poly(3-hydroxybutyrate) depolymerase
MTSYSGPISKVAALHKLNTWSVSARYIYDFLSCYSRYENAVAYANQLVIRADYAKLGIRVKTMMVNGFEREYQVYVPDSAKQLWGNKAPVLFVFPGDSQTDKVFLDATQWWKVARDKGFVLVIFCEQYNKSSVAVSHFDTDAFYRQLRAEILKNYSVDSGRVYATGQSAGSMTSQTFAAGKPEYFAAAASTSGPSSPDGKTCSGRWTLYGDNFTASNKMFPTYLIYGAGDITMLKGDLWDNESNPLDDWAQYMLGANGFTLSPDDKGKAVYSNYLGGVLARYKTWTWSGNFAGKDVALVKLTQNMYRSHNCIFEEMPMLWDFLEHYSYEVDANNNVIARYYSPSGFKVTDDKVRFYSEATSSIGK